jgi:N-acyl homoserine lactone hydrolase
MPKVDVLLNGHPLRATQGVVGFCTLALIEGTKRTLVDVGHVGRRTVLQAKLAERGLTPADIDAVVMTHAHWDHAQNLDLFDHAPVVLHPWERKYAHDPHVNDWATPKWTGAMIETQSNILEVEEGYELEPGVRVIHTPGHSPGAISVLVDTDDGVAALTGDVLHYSSVALTRRNPLVFWSEEDAAKSIDRIVDTADVIYPGHDRPFRVVGGDRIEYLQPMELELSGLVPEAEGLSWDRSPRQPWVMPGIEDQRLDRLS